ncbi:MAG: CBS domain-containing protein [Gammaproteobacteria bacterium]|nr:CBS domain-containing protein [Gammaproteobacteria bacterium]
MLIKQLLEQKGHVVVSIAPTASVYEAVARMAEKGIGALLVMDAGRVVGVISERDYARKVILQERSSKTTQVSEIMTTRVVTGRADQTISESMALMTDKRIRHLPIMDGDTVLGVISIGDLVKAIIADQQFVISQLEHYITS